METSSAIGTVEIRIEPRPGGECRLIVTTRGERYTARDEITVTGEEETFRWIRNLVGTQRAVLRRFAGNGDG